MELFLYFQYKLLRLLGVINYCSNDDYILNYFGSVDGKQIKMTEDHRLTSYTEKQRIREMGDPLKDGETRLCGKSKIMSFCLLIS